jgi:hypothetical protein
VLAHGGHADPEVSEVVTVVPGVGSVEVEPSEVVLSVAATVEDVVGVVGAAVVDGVVADGLARFVLGAAGAEAVEVGLGAEVVLADAFGDAENEFSAQGGGVSSDSAQVSQQDDLNHPKNSEALTLTDLPLVPTGTVNSSGIPEYVDLDIANSGRREVPR